MDKKYIKILMAISIVLVILIILIMVLILNINNSDQNQISIGDAGEEIDFNTTKIEPVTEKIEYYTVRNCINNYLNSLNKENTAYYIGDEYDEEIQKENIYNLLSEEYIKDINIQKDRVFNFIDILDERYIFIPVKMNVLEKENVKKYVAYGIVQNLNNEYIEDIYIFVNLDFKNKTYSIEPIEKKYNSIDEINIENDNILINKNNYNTYIAQKITNQYVTNEYFLLFKNLSLSKPEIIFNLMSIEYREKRFGDLESFKEYLNNNKEEISKINLKEYLVNTYENYIEYVAKDQFGNLYIFNEYNNQSINIKLDTYTLVEDKFLKEYTKGNDQKKVQMNIDKFIQMINRHDYITSYNYISEGFKNNYLRKQEDFEKCIKNNFFDYNKIEFKAYEKKGSNIYVYDIILTDLTGESSDVREISIIMQLNEDINFEMSFGV